MLDRINDLLDALEVDVGDPRCRRRRFHHPPAWCFTVRDASDEYAVLWQEDDDGAPVVVYVGPSF